MLMPENNFDDFNVDSKDQDKEEPSNNSNKKASLNKGQKISVILLAFFAVLVVIMWSVQFKKSISQPFTYNKDNSQNESLNTTENESEESLRIKDTDGDGLFDWDELNLYRTSPYLEDSDSDSFLDKEEIDTGNDPNCPRGRDCYSSGLIDGEKNIENEGGDTENTIDNSLLLGDLLEQLNISQEQEVSEEQIQELEKIFGGEADATVLHQMLVEAGMSEELLNQISDEELLKSYREVLGGE